MSMEKEIIKLGVSLKSFSTAVEQAVKSTKKLYNALTFYNYFIFCKKLEIRLAHRRRCVLIAFAMSKTCSPKKKWILWNLFKNT